MYGEQKISPVRKCPNCGNESLSDVCQYCGTILANTVNNLTYPEIRCKNAKVTFMGTWFPLIFAVMFLVIPLFCAVPAMIATGSAEYILFVFPFFIIGGGALAFTIRSFYMVSNVDRYGETIPGTVCGYEDNKGLLINGYPEQIIKVLVNEGQEPSILTVHLCSASKPYPVNTAVRVKKYKDMVRIDV